MERPGPLCQSAARASTVEPLCWRRIVRCWHLYSVTGQGKTTTLEHNCGACRGVQSLVNCSHHIFNSWPVVLEFVPWGEVPPSKPPVPASHVRLYVKRNTVSVCSRRVGVPGVTGPWRGRGAGYRSLLPWVARAWRGRGADMSCDPRHRTCTDRDPATETCPNIPVHRELDDAQELVQAIPEARGFLQ
eukprot:gene1883-biopygen12429